MDLTRHYLNIARRWVWLLLLTPLIASLASFWFIKQQPQVYEGKARLIVGPGVDSLSPDLNALRTSGQLMQTYAELATTRPVLQAVIDDLHLNVEPESLQDKIKIRTNEETQILSIRAYDSDPAQAAIIANSVAERLVSLSPAGTGSSESQLRAQMRSEAAKLQEIIDRGEARIAKLEEDLAAITEDSTEPAINAPVPQTVIAGAEARINVLESDLQALTDLDRQRRISQDVLQDQIRISETDIKRLEAELRNTSLPQTQLEVLDQLKQAHNQLITIQRTDMERQHRILDQTLKGTIASTQARVEQLETDLEAAGDAETQSLITSQLAQERAHLSNIQYTNLQRQRLLLDQALQQTSNTRSTRIAQLEAGLRVTFDPATRRILLSELTQELNSLTDDLQAHIDKQADMLDQVLQVSIASTKATLEELRTDYQAATAVEEERLIRDEITQERTRVSDAHQALALLYSSLQDNTTNQLKIIEPATRGDLVPSQMRLKVLIAGLAGLIIAAGMALAFEYLDVSVRTTEELRQVADVPVLGNISKSGLLRGAGRERLAVSARPTSRTAEDYRFLASQLVFPRNGRPLRSLLVSSVQSGDDTNELAANLAVALAQTGKTVVLIEANLHQPSLSRLLGITEVKNLRKTLTERSRQPQPSPPSRPVTDPEASPEPFEDLVPIEWAPGLYVLPAGPAMAHPYELLVSQAMRDLLTRLEAQADFVLIAASPQMSAADSLILASRVHGVLLVADSGKTQREAITDAVAYLRSLNAHIIGTVLHGGPGHNKLTPRHMAISFPAANGHPAPSQPATTPPAQTTLEQAATPLDQT